MRKSFLVLLVGMILIVGACTPKDSFTIQGKITGLSDGTIMELVPGATHKQEKPVAEAIMTKGGFSFTGNVETPRLYYVMVQGMNGVIPVVVENGLQVCIHGKAEKRDYNGQMFVEFSDIKVTGSPVHDEFLQKIDFRTKLDQLYEDKEKKHADINRKIGEARGNKEQVLLDSLSRTEAYAQMEKDEAAFFEKAEAEITKAVLDNKDSWWGPFLMLNLMNWFEEDQKEWFEAFSPEVQKSYYGQIVYKELFPETLEGKNAPRFTVTDSGGKKVTLQELQKNKKYILVDFWASWCAPCRKEIPNLKALYDRFAAKGLGIISISIDKDQKAWEKALSEEQLPWPNFLDDSGISDAYGVKTIPAIFLLDANGKVLSIKLRGETLQKKLEELFQ